MRWFGRGQNANTAATPILNTERLVLRGFDTDDAVHVYAYAQSDKVGPMAGFAPHMSLEDSRRMVEAFIAKGEAWAIVQKSTGRVIGSISLHPDGRRNLKQARRMGYVLGEDYWGQGYATEACREVLRYAFEELECEVMSADHFPLNQKSRRLIKKLGFTPEGVLRHARQMPDGTVNDLVCYSLLKSEYEAQKLKNK